MRELVFGKGGLYRNGKRIAEVQSFTATLTDKPIKKPKPRKVTGKAKMAHMIVEKKS